MKNTIGTSIQLTVFGESHGQAIGCVLDGLAPGIKVDEDFIAEQLSKRRPSGATDTARVEADKFSILSGVHAGYTTGSPLTIVIPNENVRSADYSQMDAYARPSHADYAAQCKYHGFQDVRGGGHFSGRITAAIVAAGAICIQALQQKGVKLATHILECAGVRDSEFSDLCSEIDKVNAARFPLIDESAEEKMTAAILAAKAEGDSVGGIVQTAVVGLPAGLGEPWFDSLESVISRAMFAIGGVKGIEFGSGFALAGMRGSQANDALRVDAEGRVATLTNHNGGINGGISNGMPVLFNLAVKPTPSILKAQQSIDYRKLENVTLEIKGRHDPAIVRRICVVVSSLLAVVLCDCLACRFGTDYLAESDEV